MRVWILTGALLLAPALTSPTTASAQESEAAEDTNGWNAQRWSAEGWKRKASRDFPGAIAAFEEALKRGGNAQALAMELGYVYTTIGRIRDARTQFQRAVEGPNAKLVEQAEIELSNLGRSSAAAGTVAHMAMTKAYEHCENGEWEKAVAALENARGTGWPSQPVDLQLGYVELQRNRTDAARAAFQAAAEGADERLAEQARSALDALPPAAEELSASALLLAEARGLRDQRRFEEALSAYRRALEEGAAPQVVRYEMGGITLLLRDLSPREREDETEARRLAEKAAEEAEKAAEEAEKAAEAAREDEGVGDESEVEKTEETLRAEADASKRTRQRREFARRFLNQAWMMKRTGDYDGAVSAFRSAQDAGADPQEIAMEIGFIELQRGDEAGARARFVEASRSTDDRVAERARAQLQTLPPGDKDEWVAEHWMIEAYRLMRGGEVDPAIIAFEKAAEMGADARRVAQEMAVVFEGRGEKEAAREKYEVMVTGDAADAYEIRGRRGLATTNPKPREDWTNDHWIGEAHLLTSLGDYAGALQALDGGRAAAAMDAGIVAEYRDVVQDARTWNDEARRFFRAAVEGPDDEIASAAREKLDTMPPDGRDAWSGNEWLTYARFLRSVGDLDGSRETYERARDEEAGDPLVDLELGYLELGDGAVNKARRYFRAAGRGDDAGYAETARAEIASMPRLFRGDVYADAYGYSRRVPQRFDNLIGTVRIRGLVRPIPRLDLEPYVFAQISRDVGSRGIGQLGDVPLILNDNALLVGGGLLFRFWKQQAGVYAQIAAAVKLIRDGRQPVTWDLRIGAYVGPSLPTCNPEPALGGLRLEMKACAEFYGDITYVSRFQHNVFFFARGRFGATWLVTGPVAWQPLIEGRFVKDVRNDYWNNVADVGFQHRWRLLRPIGIDLIVGLHPGRHLGLAREDENGVVENPVPDPPGYLDLRLLVATYFVF